MKSQREIAAVTGVTHQTVSNIQRKTGATGDELVELCKESAERTKEAENRFKKPNSKIKAKVRRIDKSTGSSLSAILQDAKEQYVKNQEIIARLQFEIDAQDNLMGGTTSKNFQMLPQVAAMEKFVKANITLRNQIIQLEGMSGVSEEDSNPFD